MILLVTKDGNVRPYIQYEIIDNNTLALQRDTNCAATAKCIVTADNIQQTLKTGVIKQGNPLPMIYDFDKHGALTNESFAKYGVPVTIQSIDD